MTKSPEEVLEGFRSATESYEQNRDHSKESISNFVRENFTVPEDHLESHIPADWKENPRLLSDISDPDLAEFASHLNSRWKTLCRKTSKQVLESAERQDTALQSVMSDFGIHHIFGSCDWNFLVLSQMLILPCQKIAGTLCSTCHILSWFPEVAFVKSTTGTPTGSFEVS